MWLAAASLGSMAVGLALVVATGTPLFDLYNATAARAFFGGRPMSGATLDHHRWALSLTGAGTMGWAIMMTFVVLGPFRRREPWAWWCLGASVLVWLAADVAASLYWGVRVEVWFAAGAGALILLPLLAVRDRFRR